ncbi:MAG: 3-methyl-2-oxobutanoate hydroxymethyltransferase [Anaerolineae bacterium]|jgi:3-methyl-2-oxobutanoate hydroxymethyltransferase|nr:3-methyl-2-oxobutanoate hydroxymethyltransferase [Anaerolineae bacterium]
MAKKTSILSLQDKKARGEPITMITAYDYPSALAAERAGIDSILVGDSLGMVVLGYDSTVPVTMDEMIHHCKAVRRGAERAYLIGDMPFMSYQADVAEAVRNAGRFLKEAGMDAVKLEGGREVAPAIEAITRAGMSVVGHIGLTPQSVAKIGGYLVQGATANDAQRLLDDAFAVQDAGAVMVVLEKVPDRVAARISRKLRIPTIGIGAGLGCDGQVLVLHDMLGIFDRFTPRFVKRYAEVMKEMERGLSAYREDVEQRRFPDCEHSFPIDDAEWAAWAGSRDGSGAADEESAWHGQLIGC